MKKALLTKVLPVIVLLTAFNAHSAEYVIDTKGAHASILFKFKHIGISWLTGEFKKFDGTFTFDEDNPGNSKVSVNIDPASLDSNHAERDRHIKGSDYLDVETYPEASFVSTRIVPGKDGEATVYGDLTLHGQTREVAIEASLVGKGEDPWGGYRAGFEGTTTIETEDFGFSMPPTNKVHMELHIEGVRQD